ncbi:MAG: trypsin-like serine protease [Nocardioidaceae bacterium]
MAPRPIRLPRALTVAATVLAAVLAAVPAAVLGTASSASASIGGTADGAMHPNVAMLLFYGESGAWRCSGTLVSPTVVLTAAHCTDAAVGRTLVTFDSVVAERAPSGLPTPSDPAAGFTREELARAGRLSGTSATHAGFSHFTDLRRWNDVGVVVLDSPVTDIVPARLGGLGVLDAYAAPRLSKTLFTAVGYGVDMLKPATGPQRPQATTYPLLRRYVDMPGQKLTPQILQTNGNPSDPHGTGGTCGGDSGGPVFLDGRLVALTSYGLSDNCRSPGGYQRVDIEAVRDWLRGFGL